MTPETSVRPDRVAIYVRWSTDDQADGTTLETQLEGCKHYILSQGWRVNDKLVFVDDGYSGGTLKRPALDRLRRLVRDRQIDCVVVFKLDRLSRSVIDMVNLVLREWEGKTYVKSAREPLDTSSAMGKQFFYMLVSFAEWERNVIRERTQGGRLKRAQEGKNPGFRPPYGYSRGDTPGSFQVVESEAALVRRIFDMYLGGLGYSLIASTLNEEGLRFRGGRPWGQRTIYEILSNRIYVGELVFGKRPVNPRHQIDGGPRQVRNDRPLVVVSPHVPPTVSAEVFAQAQAMRQARAKERAPSRTLTSVHLLTGIAKCMKCGYAFLGRKNTSVKGQRYDLPYYMCGGLKNRGRSFCDCGYIRQDALDAWVVDKLLQRYRGDVGREQLRQDLGASTIDQLTAATQRLAEVRAEMAAVERELQVLARDYRREKLSVDEFNAQKAEVDQERQRLVASATELEEQIQTLKHRQAHSAALEGLLVTSLARWDSLDLPQKKHLLRQLVSSLRVYKAPGASELEYDLAWVGG